MGESRGRAGEALRAVRAENEGEAQRQSERETPLVRLVRVMAGGGWARRVRDGSPELC